MVFERDFLKVFLPTVHLNMILKSLTLGLVSFILKSAFKSQIPFLDCSSFLGIIFGQKIEFWNDVFSRVALTALNVDNQMLLTSNTSVTHSV